MDVGRLKGLGATYSALIVSPIGRLQGEVDLILQHLVAIGKPLLYISLNKPQVVVEAALQKKGIKTDAIVFVDTVAESLGQASGMEKENVIHVANPADLTSLHIALSDFLRKSKGEASILVDALATLLIYNGEDLVVKFTRDLVEKSRQSRTVVFTQPAGGTEFLAKIAVFFSTVLRDENGAKKVD